MGFPNGVSVLGTDGVHGACSFLQRIFGAVGNSRPGLKLVGHLDCGIIDLEGSLSQNGICLGVDLSGTLSGKTLRPLRAAVGFQFIGLSVGGESLVLGKLCFQGRIPGLQFLQICRDRRCNRRGLQPGKLLLSGP